MTVQATFLTTAEKNVCANFESILLLNGEFNYSSKDHLDILFLILKFLS